jgi:hypothetical protein
MRSVMMPRRERPRVEDTARRLAAERRRNAERLTLERLRAWSVHAPDGEPPPF